MVMVPNAADPVVALGSARLGWFRTLKKSPRNCKCGCSPNGSGIAKFFINSNDGSSSLLPIDGSSAAQWGESVNFSVIGEVSIPTIRLDTFMHLAKIERVDYLKVDAEGADLLVIKSAADRIRDIRTIKAEVEVCDFRSFVGAPSKVEMISFMKEKGFSLTAVESQNEDRQENLTFTQTNIL